jgi:hypothetical protein
MSDRSPEQTLYHITPFEHRDSDGPRILFLVNGDDGSCRSITVERDDADGYHLLVDGDGYYDAEAESPYLTQHLMDETDRLLAKTRSVGERLDRYLGFVGLAQALARRGGVN